MEFKIFELIQEEKSGAASGWGRGNGKGTCWPRDMELQAGVTNSQHKDVSMANNAFMCQNS